MEDKVIRYLQNLERDRLEALSKKSSEEHLIAIIKAAFELIPGVGGALSTLIDEYYPNRQIERLISFVEDLARRLRRLETRVKTERINPDDFGDLFFETLRLASREHQQEKIEAYRAILLNALVSPDHIAEESELFLSLVRELTALHIQMLRVLYQPRESIPDSLRFQRQGGQFETTVRATLHRVFAGAPDGLLDAIWTGLRVRGLVFESNYEQRLIIQVAFSPRETTDFTEQVLEHLPKSLTSSGRRFIQYITEPPNDDSSNEHS